MRPCPKKRRVRFCGRKDSFLRAAAGTQVSIVFPELTRLTRRACIATHSRAFLKPPVLIVERQRPSLDEARPSSALAALLFPKYLVLFVTARQQIGQQVQDFVLVKGFQQVARHDRRF